MVSAKQTFVLTFLYMGYPMARKGLFAALEEEMIGEAGTGEEVSEALLDAKSGDEESQTAVSEVSEMTAAVEEAVEGAEEISDISEVAEQTVETGEGMSPEAAQIAEVAVEAICTRLEMPYYRRTVPAMESFGQKHSRLSATKIALEGFKEKIKEIWEGIKNFVKKIWEKIKDFFAKFFSNPEKTKKAAEALRDKAADKQGSGFKAKDDKVSIGGAAAKITKGKEYTPGGLAEMVDNHTHITNGFGNIAKALGAASDSLQSLATSGFSNITIERLGETEAAVRKITDAITGVKVNKVAATADKNAKDEIGPFVGNLHIVIEFSKNGGAPTVSTENLERDSKIDGKVKALTSSKEISDVCTTVINLMNITLKYKQELPKLDTTMKAVQSVIDSVIKLVGTIADNGEDNRVRPALVQMQHMVTGISNGLQRLVTLIPAMNTQLGNAMLSFASASYHNLEKKS